MKKSLVVIFTVLFLDQASKIWVKTSMTLYEEIPVFGDWFVLHFIENPGMAFGMQFGGDWGKLILSLFRIVAITGIGYYLHTLIKQKAKTGLIISISLILTGALGNIVDSAVYGLMFNESTYHTVATLFPEGGGYTGFLKGKVVDMLYFPLFEGQYPSWLFGGKKFIFFSPVFNIADSAITIGVSMIILFQRKFFKN